MDTLAITARIREGYNTATPVANVQTEVSVVLRTEGLKKHFGGQVVLAGVDLELRRGEAVLLRGENGSGKTTLLNMLTGNLSPDAGVIHYRADSTPRSYRFPRRWWQELNPFDHFTPEFVAREGVCRTWQDVRLFNTQTLTDNIAVAEPGHPGENPMFALLTPGRSAAREAHLNRAAVDMLRELGLAGREDSSADKISLGQSKRVAIARAVAAGARILFLDEPLAGLDRKGVRDVLTLLEALSRDHAVTLVIIEHVFNQPHLRRLVTTDWLLEGGKLKRMDGDSCGASSISPIDNSEQATAPRRPGWFSRLAGEGAQIVEEALPRGALLTRIRNPETFSRSTVPALEIRGLIVRRGPRIVIGSDDEGSESGFNLTLYHGEIAILQAPNGWGKSTLIAAIAGLLATHGGQIFLQNTLVQRLPIYDRVRRGLYTMLSDNGSFPQLRGNDVLRLAGCPNEARALGALAGRPVSSLSGGQKQLLGLLGMARVENATLRVFDEPLAMLDEQNIDRALRILRDGSNSAALIAIPSSTL